MPEETRKVELLPDDHRIFELNMQKLHTMLPAMFLTVPERNTLEELVKAWFGKEPPPPVPWVQRSREAKEKP